MKKLMIYSVFLMLTSYLSYVSAQRIGISKERNQMVEQIATFDFHDITLYKSMLDNNGLPMIYNLVMVYELELINILRGDYVAAISKIRNNETDYFDQRNNRTHLIGLRFMSPPYEFVETMRNDAFNQALLDYVKYHENKIIEGIHASNQIREIDKNFLEYFIRLHIHYHDPCNDRLHERKIANAKRLIQAYPSSGYAKIAKKYSSVHLSVSELGKEFSYKLYGFQAPINGNYNNHVGAIHSFVGINYGQNYRNIFARAGISLGLAPIKDHGYQDYQDRNTMRFFSYQFLGGYNFNVNENLRIAPFIGYSMNHGRMGIYHNDNLLEEEHNPFDEVIRLRSFQPIIGLSIDILSDQEYHCSQSFPSAQMFSRLEIGFTRFQAPLGSEFLATNMFYAQFSFGMQWQNTRGIRML